MSGGLIFGIIQFAFLQRQAATTNAPIQFVAQSRQRIDLGIKVDTEAVADFLPIFWGWRSCSRKLMKQHFDFFDGESELLGNQHKRQPPDVRT